MTDTGHTDGRPDAVRPLDESGQPIETDLAASSRSRNPWLVFAGAAGLVLLLGAVGAWLWWVNVIRGPLGAAEVLPGSADVVLTFDALELIEGDRFVRLVNTFDPGGFDLDEIISEVDDEIEEEVGLRVMEDVRSWIGRSVAIAVWMPPDLLTTFDAEPEIAISVMTRNEARARDSIDEIVVAAQRDGAEIDTVTIAGVEVYSVASETVPALITVHSGRVLLATEPGRMAEMIDPSDPITDRSAYDRLWEAAGGDGALASIYLGQNFLEDLVTAATEAGGTNAISLPTGAVLATATLDDDGFQFSGASIALDERATTVSGTWAAELPTGTYGYVSARLPFDREDIEALFDDQVDSLRDVGLGQDVDASLAEFESAFGVSLREVVAQFGGEMLLAAIQSDLGPMPALAGGPLGVGFAIGVEDEEIVRDVMASLPELLGPDGDMIVPAGDGLWVVDVGDGELVTYGVSEGRLLVASDPDTVDAVLGRSGGGLTDDPTWQRLAGLIGQNLVLYVDIARITSTFAPVDIAADLAPLRSLGASATLEDGVSLVRMRLVIDY